MRRIKFFDNLRYKEITDSRPDKQTNRLLTKKKKKETTCRLVDRRVKTKEIEKKNKHLNLPWEL